MTCSLPQSGEINIHLDHRLGQVLLVPDEMVDVVQIEHQLHGVPDRPHQMQRLSRQEVKERRRWRSLGTCTSATAADLSSCRNESNLVTEVSAATVSASLSSNRFR
jgi:hypothetical protein